MKGKKRWEELLLYKLEGARFDAHEGLHLRDLGGLYQLHELLLELAKADFRMRLGRERSPKGVDDLFDVRIRGFEDGCVQVRVLLGREIKGESAPPAQTELFAVEPVAQELSVDDEFLESVQNAAWYAEAALAALSSGTPLPAGMPNDTFARLRSVFAASIRDDERITLRALRPRAAAVRPRAVDPVPSEVTIAPRAPVASEGDPEDPRSVLVTPITAPQDIAARTGGGPSRPTESGTPPAPSLAPSSEPGLESLPSLRTVPVDRDVLDRLASRAEEERREREAAASRAATRARILEGEVRMVDVDGRTVRLRTQSGQVLVHISADHEREVTRALDKHDVARLRVRGNAIHGPSGAPRELTAERVAVVEPLSRDAPSEELFERLAREDPERLLRLLTGGEQLAAYLLTYAAEIAGRLLSGERVVGALLKLLRHPEAVVREGAIYGLASHGDDSRVAGELERLRDSDPSPGVRQAAEETLQVMA